MSLRSTDGVRLTFVALRADAQCPCGQSLTTGEQAARTRPDQKILCMPCALSLSPSLPTQLDGRGATES